jgi:hypothetical protein
VKNIFWFLPFLLAGCGNIKSVVDTKVVTQYKYVVVKIPDDLFVIPMKHKVPDETATDKDIAYWIIDSDGRADKLENQILMIDSYQKQKLQSVLSNIKKEEIIE